MNSSRTSATNPALPRAPGSYVLWLIAQKPFSVVVGRLGTCCFPEGRYAYVGSAFGPGGLAARLTRHLRRDKSIHWHIDALRASCAVDAIWLVKDAQVEHAWAQLLAQHPDSSQPVHGLGSSDCRCPTHLFRFSRPLSLSAFHAWVEAVHPGLALPGEARLGTSPQ